MGSRFKSRNGVQIWTQKWGPDLRPEIGPRFKRRNDSRFKEMDSKFDLRNGVQIWIQKWSPNLRSEMVSRFESKNGVQIWAQTYWQTDRLTDSQTDISANWQTDRLTGRQTDRAISWHTDRWTAWQTDQATTKSCRTVFHFFCIGLDKTSHKQSTLGVVKNRTKNNLPTWIRIAAKPYASYMQSSRLPTSNNQDRNL